MTGRAPVGDGGTKTKVPATGLRARHSDETRGALIGAARRLFAAKGYHGVGIREFSAEAGLTRGALYHHFQDKEDLFLAVVEQIRGEQQADAARRHRAPNRPDRWTQLRQDLQHALDAMLAPGVARIVLIEAPSVLGWQRWRDHGARFGIAAIGKAIEASIADGLIEPAPVRQTAQLISASFNEAALMIVHASDTAAARDSVGKALDALLSGLLKR